MRSDSDPATRQLVELLQNQMQEVQQQISTIGSEAPVDRPTSGTRPKTAGARGSGLVTSALQVSNWMLQLKRKCDFIYM